MVNFSYGAIPSTKDNRDYPIDMLIASASAEKLPREYIPKIKIPILDQGTVNCCVACSLAYCRYIRENEQKHSANKYSVIWIYGNRRSTDWQGIGMMPREAIKNLKEDGVPLYNSLSGYLEVDKAIPKVKAVKSKLKSEARKYRISSYYACSSINDIKQGVLSCGAVSALFPVYDVLQTAGKDGIVKAHSSKENKGYHQMTIIGWRVINKAEYWIVLNSWGIDYGDEGKCYIPMKGYPIIESWAMIDNI